MPKSTAILSEFKIQLVSRVLLCLIHLALQSFRQVFLLQCLTAIASTACFPLSVKQYNLHSETEHLPCTFVLQ